MPRGRLTSFEPQTGRCREDSGFRTMKSDLRSHTPPASIHSLCVPWEVTEANAGSPSTNTYSCTKEQGNEPDGWIFLPLFVCTLRRTRTEQRHRPAPSSLVNPTARCQNLLGAEKAIPNHGLRLPEEDSRPSVPSSDRSGPTNTCRKAVGSQRWSWPVCSTAQRRARPSPGLQGARLPPAAGSGSPCTSESQF